MASAVGVQVPPPAPKEMRRAVRRPCSEAGEFTDNSHVGLGSMQVNETTCRWPEARNPGRPAGYRPQRARCEKRLDDIKDDVHLRGFRKGKVPKPHLRRRSYGRRLMLEVLQEAVEESSKQALDDRNERPVAQPDIAFPEDQAEIEEVVSGSKDFSYSMTYEVIPPIDLVDFESLEVERIVAESHRRSGPRHGACRSRQAQHRVRAERGKVSLKTVTRSKLISSEKSMAKRSKAARPRMLTVVIGQGGFIPGFRGRPEECCKGGDPDYGYDELSGGLSGRHAPRQGGCLRCHRQGSRQAKRSAEVNDELANRSSELRKPRRKAERIGHRANQSERIDDQISRAKLKRSSARYPGRRSTASNCHRRWSARNSMGSGTSQLGADEAGGKIFRRRRTNAAKKRCVQEYEDGCRTRVRLGLGLVLGEIGEKFEVKVEQEELREALVQQARQFPGQEQHVYEYFEKTPGAVGQLRGADLRRKGCRPGGRQGERSASARSRARNSSNRWTTKSTARRRMPLRPRRNRLRQSVRSAVRPRWCDTKVTQPLGKLGRERLALVGSSQTAALCNVLQAIHDTAGGIDQTTPCSSLLRKVSHARSQWKRSPIHSGRWSLSKRRVVNAATICPRGCSRNGSFS